MSIRSNRGGVMGMWNWAEGFLPATQRIGALMCNKPSSVPKPPAETIGPKRTAETMHALAATTDNKIHADVDALIMEATEQSKLQSAVNVTYTRKLHNTVESLVESAEFHAENDVDPAKVVGGLHGEMGMATPIFMWHPTVKASQRPMPIEGEEGYSMWVGVVDRKLRHGAYFVGNSKTDLRCGGTGEDMRETTVDIRISKTRKIRYTAILYNVLGQRMVTLLPFVQEGACLFRATLLRMMDHVKTTLGAGGLGVHAVPSPESRMCFMEVYADISATYFDMIWRGPSCGSVVLDGLWDRFKGEKERAAAAGGAGAGDAAAGGAGDAVAAVAAGVVAGGGSRIPLDWSSPMDLLRAALCRRESERGDLETRALVAALVFNFGLEATFSALIDLVRSYTPEKHARPVTTKWVLWSSAPATILDILTRISLMGTIGSLSYACKTMDALAEHTCPSWRRQAMLDAGRTGEDFYVKYDFEESDDEEEGGGAHEHKGGGGGGEDEGEDEEDEDDAPAAAGDGLGRGKKRAASDNDSDSDNDEHKAKQARAAESASESEDEELPAV